MGKKVIFRLYMSRHENLAFLWSWVILDTEVGAEERRVPIHAPLCDILPSKNSENLGA